ncbi:MAG: hypothetical protein HC869_22215 [Rhodospirillales bacterium]|nr:hypothetical protein [Rhodospirillales bacterium]
MNFTSEVSVANRNSPRGKSVVLTDELSQVSRAESERLRFFAHHFPKDIIRHSATAAELISKLIHRAVHQLIETPHALRVIKPIPADRIGIAGEHGQRKQQVRQPLLSCKAAECKEPLNFFFPS